MILFDGVHLVSDLSLDELHKFANSPRIGLKREWFQDRRYPHYDVFGCKVLTVQKVLPPDQLVRTQEIIKRVMRGMK
jgi:hypothetical protein